MSNQDHAQQTAGVDDPWGDAQLFARSPVVALLVLRLAHPTFTTVEGWPFFCGPEWEGDTDAFIRFVRRQLRHARWQRTTGHERDRLFADLSEVDLGGCLNAYVVDGDGSGDVLDDVAGTLQYTWADALHRQYGPGSYAVTVVPFSAEDLDGPYLRYERCAEHPDESGAPLTPRSGSPSPAP